MCVQYEGETGEEQDVVEDVKQEEQDVEEDVDEENEEINDNEEEEKKEEEEAEEDEEEEEDAPRSIDAGCLCRASCRLPSSENNKRTLAA